MLDGAQKLRNEEFQQRHARCRKLGTVSLNMPEAWKAAEHIDQKSARLNSATAYRLAGLGQHLDLISIRHADHADEASDLDNAAATALSHAQPRRVCLVGRTQALAFQPFVHRDRDDVHTIGS